MSEYIFAIAVLIYWLIVLGTAVYLIDQRGSS